MVERPRMRPVAEGRQEAEVPGQAELMAAPHHLMRPRWRQRHRRLREELGEQEEEHQLARRRLLAEH